MECVVHSPALSDVHLYTLVMGTLVTLMSVSLCYSNVQCVFDVCPVIITVTYTSV